MNEFEKHKYIDTIPKSNKIKRLIWNTIWLFLFRPTPRWALNSWRIFLLKLFGAKIGKGSRVLPSCKVWAPWNLTIGKQTVLGDDVDCYTMDKITIGNHVSISQRTFLCTGTHDISTYLKPLITHPIVIEDNVWICAESFISPNITIKDSAVIAARSVVIKDVESFHVVAGNPAKFIKLRIIKEEE
jgi:putative colanic acid biosynthesis acetyltransferase WcaF